MKKKIMVILFLIIAIIPQTIVANSESWSTLDALADRALKLTKQEKYEEAKQVLNQFADQFVKTKLKDTNITMNDLRVISISADEAIKAVTAISLDPIDRIRKVTQLRLAIDAIHSEHQPLWREIEGSLLESFTRMKNYVNSGDKEKFKLEYNNFSGIFATIFPSLVIDLEPDEVARLDSHVRFLEKYDSLSLKNKQDHLAAMEHDLLKLFGKITKDEADPSLIWLMVMIGSIVLITLVYVGWRKYKGEKRVRGRGRY